MPWTQREFTFDQPAEVFPAILERLRGTPVRAADLALGTPEEVLGQRVNERWSVKDHLGHIADLAVLDEQRLCEYLSRVPVLSPADLGNGITESGNHRETPIQEVLRSMREGRNRLVEKLEQLTTEDVATSAMHPRLQKPMRLVDWVHFVAEHDDHHLAKARRMIRKTGHAVA